MSLLGACRWLAVTFANRRKVTMADDRQVRPIWFTLVALASLTLWFGVGAGGRWIGFSG